MKFIAGMIVGEINGIALGIAGTVVAIAVWSMLDKEEKSRSRYAPKYSDYIYNKYQKEDQNE